MFLLLLFFSESYLRVLRSVIIVISGETPRRVGNPAHCPVPVIRHGVEDEFGRSGAAQKVLDAYGLNAEGIAAKVREAMDIKAALTL